MTPEQREELGLLLFEIRMDGQNGIRCQASEDAVVAFISSLTTPPWTSELPKAPGGYWWKRSAVSSRECVLEVVVGHNKVSLFCPDPEDDIGRLVKVEQLGGLWSGPLPKPPRT